MKTMKIEMEVFESECGGMSVTVYAYPKSFDAPAFEEVEVDLYQETISGWAEFDGLYKVMTEAIQWRERRQQENREREALKAWTPRPETVL